LNDFLVTDNFFEEKCWGGKKMLSKSRVFKNESSMTAENSVGEELSNRTRGGGHGEKNVGNPG